MTRQAGACETSTVSTTTLTAGLAALTAVCHAAAARVNAEETAALLTPDCDFCRQPKADLAETYGGRKICGECAKR